MLAKCTRCAQTFQTDRFGEQFCPFCGAPVMIAQPAPPTEPGLPPQIPPAGTLPPMPEEGPHDQDAAMDNTTAHGGLVSAFIATWKQSVFEPAGFFGRLRIGTGWGGALPFAIICLVVGGVFAGAYQGLMLGVQARMLPPQALHMIGGFLRFGPLWAILLPIFAVVGLFVNVALTHLALMIVGGAHKGFTATFRAVGYSQGPYLFGLVPLCGSYVAGIWILVLSVIAVSKMHGITIGRAIGAYVLMIFVLCCCCGLPIGMSAGFAAARAAQHGVVPIHAPAVDDADD